MIIIWLQIKAVTILYTIHPIFFSGFRMDTKSDVFLHLYHIYFPYKVYKL